MFIFIRFENFEKLAIYLTLNILILKGTFGFNNFDFRPCLIYTSSMQFDCSLDFLQRKTSYTAVRLQIVTSDTASCRDKRIFSRKIGRLMNKKLKLNACRNRCKKKTFSKIAQKPEACHDQVKIIYGQGVRVSIFRP